LAGSPLVWEQQYHEVDAPVSLDPVPINNRKSKTVAPEIKAFSVCQSASIFRKMMEFGLSSNALILFQMSGPLTSRPSHSTNCHPPLQKVECTGVGNLMKN